MEHNTVGMLRESLQKAIEGKESFEPRHVEKIIFKELFEGKPPVKGSQERIDAYSLAYTITRGYPYDPKEKIYTNRRKAVRVFQLA